MPRLRNHLEPTQGNNKAIVLASKGLPSGSFPCGCRFSKNVYLEKLFTQKFTYLYKLLMAGAKQISGPTAHFFFSGPLFQKVRPKRAGPKWSRRSLKQKALPKPGPATAVKPCPQTRPRLIRAWQCLSPVVPISGVAPFVLLDSTFSIEYSSRLCVRHDLIVPHRKLSALGHGAGWIWGVMMQLVFGLMESIEKKYIYILTNDFRCRVGTT